MEQYLWTYFLNNREGDFQDGRRYYIVATAFLEDKNNSWYRKLDIVECTIKYLQDIDKRYNNWRTPVNQMFIKQRPTADYRNSIKESISAVEAFCREKTDENSLGKALNHLEANGIIIPKLLKVAFDKLYAYTNQPDTGIRHALMDSDGAYTPASEEALFMLVSCSAFLNYLCRKIR